jgi:glycosyltransferase involved in cell wall biosynthesis
VVPDGDVVGRLAEVYREAGDRSIIGARVFSTREPWVVMEGGMEWDEREMTWVPARYAEWRSDEPCSDVEEVDALGPSVLLIPREALEKAGEFDPRFSSGWGVAEWCSRARQAGFRCYVATKAKAWADESYGDWGKETPQNAYERALSEALCAKRCSSTRDFLWFLAGKTWKHVKDDVLSVPFAVGTSEEGAIGKRLYWAGRKYVKDVRKRAGLLGRRIRGIRESLTRRGEQPVRTKAERSNVRVGPWEGVAARVGARRDRRELKILFLSHIFPYPLDNGAHIRVHNMMEALARAGRVDWIGYTSEGGEGRLPDREAMENFRGLCASAQVLCDPPRKRSRARNGIRALSRQALHREPEMYATYPAAPLLRRARQLMGKADLIWVESMHLAHRLRVYRDRMIVDTIDLHAIRASRERDLEPMSLGKAAKWFEIRKLKHEEETAVTRYSRVVVCSENERVSWASDDRGRVWVVPNGVSEALFRHHERQEAQDRLVFVGTLEYGPNEDAVMWFCNEVLPRVAREVPTVSFFVVGRNPSRRLKELHDGRRVNVIGRVPDVTAYVREAALSVVPLRAGGGTRLKILESLALGTPVVSTSVGVEGLALEPGTDLLVADDPEAFASAVVRSLRNRDIRRCLADAGRERVRAAYGWHGIQDNLVALVREWAEERGLEIANRETGEGAVLLEDAPRGACGANV